MQPDILTAVLTVRGMTCSSCELKIENSLRKLEGVAAVTVSLARSEVKVEFDQKRIQLETIQTRIVKLGYEVGDPVQAKSAAGERFRSVNQLLGIGIILFALYLIIKSTVGFNFIPQVDQSMGYGMLFVIGLLTSLHCIAMCGGINLTQSIAGTTDPTESRFAKLRPSLLYNAGRVVSYTVVGGIVGALGAVVSFSGTAKGLVAIVGGVFMVIMGLNMLGTFPWLQRLTIRMPKVFGNQIYNNNGKRGSFIVGLLNGLMPCGPLQAMQLYALGTGSFWAGALSMFLFSIGTVPLMFGFGAVSTLLSRKFTHRMIKVSAVLVMVLGLVMLGRGLSLSGVSIAAPGSIAQQNANVARIEGNVQVVTTTFTSGRYQPFVVQKGIPVRWIIKVSADDLNGCNNPVTVPQYNIQKRLAPGENIIEFTPDREGTIAYTCWMGMISSYIKVVPDVANVSANDLQADNKGANANLAGGGSCCSDGAKATKFQNGRIPADQVQVAPVVAGIQEVTITVNDEGFAPAVVVLQKGMKAKFKFIPEKLNSCNNVVTFPAYGGQLDLRAGQLETPALEISQDFTFQCWMGMINAYVKTVADRNQVDIPAIQREVSQYQANAGGGGASCCRR